MYASEAAVAPALYTAVLGLRFRAVETTVGCVFVNFAFRRSFHQCANLALT